MTTRAAVLACSATFIAGLLVGAVAVLLAVLFEPEPCTYEQVQRYGEPACHQH